MAASSTVFSALVLAALALPVWGAEVGGAKLDDKVRVANTELTLVGAGVRKRYFFDVYAIGLYLPQRKADSLTQPVPKRVQLHMLRDVGARQFSDALAEGMQANHSQAEMKALERGMNDLIAIMEKVGEARRGTAIALDWTGSATQVLVDGKPAGAPIPGEPFYRGLLRVWLGEHPAQDDLKTALLGG